MRQRTRYIRQERYDSVIIELCHLRAHLDTAIRMLEEMKGSPGVQMHTGKVAENHISEEEPAPASQGVEGSRFPQP